MSNLSILYTHANTRTPYTHCGNAACHPVSRGNLPPTSLSLSLPGSVLRQRPVAHRESVITSANEILQSSVPRAAALDAFLATLIARVCTNMG